jgi:serralysin
MSDYYREQAIAFLLNSSESAAVDPLAGELDNFVDSGGADRAPPVLVEPEQTAEAAENSDDLVFEEEDSLPRIAATASLDTSDAADQYSMEIDPSITLSLAPSVDLSTALFAHVSPTVDFAISEAFTVDSGDVPDQGVPSSAFAAGGQHAGSATGAPPQPDENGSGDTTVAVAASGNQQIDGLLRGNRWADGFITYSDPDSVADYGGGYDIDPNNNPLAGFSQVSAQQMIAVHFGLNSAIFTQPVGAAGFGVEGFTNLTIDYAGSGSGAGTIRVANSTDPGTAYAYYPANNQMGGDAFFGPSGDFPTAGNYDWHTVLHELGHSLGLKHGHETNVYGALPSNVDSQEYSIMTYRTFVGDDTSGYNYETWGAPQTFMMLDIAALQYMYGADYTTNNTDTVYTWSPTGGETMVNGNVAIDPGGNRIFATVWDGGGVDTYDLSNYTTNLTIDLAPGGHSVFSSTQLAFLGGGPNGGFARGNIFNALLFAGNTASLIENAYGGSGNDSISGNQGNNTLKGGGGNDSLYGLAGNDFLIGDAGDDYLDDSSGGDSVSGGSGNDWVHMGDAGISGDSYDGGSDFDTFDASHFVWAVDVTIDLTAGVWSYSAGSEAVTNFENIRGSSNASGTTETLRGNASNNAIYGNGGVDVIHGEAGDDYLDGGAAADTINGGDGNDTIVGASGSDTLNGGAGNDILEGGTDGDVLNGGDGNDILYNGSAADPDMSGITDTMNGDAGNDVLIGSGFANDIMNGGTGGDTLQGRGGADAHDGGSGFDYASYQFAVAGLTVRLDAPALNTGDAAGDTYVNVEGLIGSGFNDTLVGDAGANILWGINGNDQLFGGIGNDTLIGGAGADVNNGGAGFDYASYTGSAGLTARLDNPALNTGGAAGDTYIGIEGLIGTSFNDTLVGDAAANGLQGSGGNDQLFGGNGNDTLVGGAGADLNNGGAGFDYASYSGSAGLTARLDNPALNTGDAAGDTYVGIEGLIGSSFNDTLVGDALVNALRGGSGNDALYGGGANDTLIGQDGNDALYGQNGNDTLDGQAGTDGLIGGAGFDTFLYRLNYDGDTISGFTDNVDQINLDDNLWGGVLTVAQVLTAFATQTSANIVDFDFGGGDTLRVSQAGITIAALQNDILIV